MADIAKIIEKVVATYTEDKKAEVRDSILQLGILPDDPLLNLYAEMGTTQFALQQLPAKLDSLVVGWTDMVDDKLNCASKVAIQQQKSAIAEAAKELVKKTGGGGLPQLGLGLSNVRLAQIAVAFGSVLALGSGIGIFTYKTVAGSSSTVLASSSAIKPEDQKILNWVKSEDGQLARKIYLRNAPIIKTCRQPSRKEKGCVIAVD
jgi:hypothetical protein